MGLSYRKNINLHVTLRYLWLDQDQNYLEARVGYDISQKAQWGLRKGQDHVWVCLLGRGSGLRVRKTFLVEGAFERWWWDSGRQRWA